MKKVRIDFAPAGVARTVLRAPRPAWALLWVSVCLAPVLVSGTVTYGRLVREQDRLRAQLAVARAASMPPPSAVPARAPVPASQADAVNAAVLQLNVPWRALHDAVQSATPPSIALLALEPDAKKRRLRITAEAKSSDDMIAYVGELEHEDWFSAVSLMRHEINEQDPNRPIRFQIDADWSAAR